MRYKGTRSLEPPGQTSSLDLEYILTRTPMETSPSRSKLSQVLSNTTHNGVGYYAPVAQTTLNPYVFLCSFISSSEP
jgi:hypothetical protein